MVQHAANRHEWRSLYNNLDFVRKFWSNARLCPWQNIKQASDLTNASERKSVLLESIGKPALSQRTETVVQKHFPQGTTDVLLPELSRIE